MGAGCSSETFVTICQTYNPEDHNINILTCYRTGYFISLLFIMLDMESFIKNMFQYGNMKLWKELIAYFLFNVYGVFDMTRTAQKMPCPTFLLLLRLYLLLPE